MSTALMSFIYALHGQSMQLSSPHSVQQNNTYEKRSESVVRLIQQATSTCARSGSQVAAVINLRLIHIHSDGERDCCCTSDDHGVLGGLRHGAAIGYWPCVAAPGSRRLWWRRCHTVPPAVVPSAAEGGTLVRHEQLKWWLPAAPMIYERIFTLFASIYNI